jgi:O-antigen/teichoic acid export membrane protein
MSNIIPKNLKELRMHLKDPLFKNSYFILLTSGSISIFGLVFWVIIARFYSPDEVGLASAILSISQLICAFSILGLNYSVIRFFSQRDDRNEMINSCFSLVGISAMIFTIVVLVTLQYWSPTLIILRENYFLLVSFIILTVLYAIFSLQSNVFIAARVMKLSFLQNLIFNLLRTPLPLFFISFGILGIVSSWTVATVIAFLVGSLWLIPKVLPGYRRVPKINKKILKEIMSFSFGNYISGVLGSLPTMIMPLLIVNILDVENAAYFLVAWSITVIISALPGAVTTSLFAEGSSNQEAEFHSNLIKSIKLIFFLLIPIILIIFVFSDKVLLLFGQTYSENATRLLGLFMIGCIPFAINQIYLTIKRVQIDIKPMIYVNLCIAILVISGSYILMKTVGLIGIGIAWIIGQGAVAVFVGAYLIINYRTITNK